MYQSNTDAHIFITFQAERTADNRKERYLTNFEERRKHRDELYRRLIKVTFLKKHETILKLISLETTV